MCKSEEQKREDRAGEIYLVVVSDHILSLALIVTYQTSGPKLVGMCG